MLVTMTDGECLPRSVLKVTAYIVGIGNWATFDRLFKNAFGDAKPARSIVPVPALHHGYLVEIDAVAAKTDFPE